MIAYGDVDGDGKAERFRYYLEGTEVKMDITNPTTDVPPQYPQGSDQTLLIASHVVNSQKNVPLFRYYDHQNTLLTGSFPINAVRMVEVKIIVRSTAYDEVRDVVIQSLASLRNIRQ